MAVTFIYLGGRFYCESSTRMSSLMFEDKSRASWNSVEGTLKENVTVIIRPATAEELETAEVQLAEIKEDLERNRVNEG